MVQHMSMDDGDGNGDGDGMRGGHGYSPTVHSWTPLSGKTLQSSRSFARSTTGAPPSVPPAGVNSSSNPQSLSSDMNSHWRLAPIWDWPTAVSTVNFLPAGMVSQLPSSTPICSSANTEAGTLPPTQTAPFPSTQLLAQVQPPSVFLLEEGGVVQSQDNPQSAVT